MRSRRGRDPAARQAFPQAGPRQLGRAVHRRVHVAARAATEPARAARHRHLRRRRQRRGIVFIIALKYIFSFRLQNKLARANLNISKRDL